MSCLISLVLLSCDRTDAPRQLGDGQIPNEFDGIAPHAPGVGEKAKQEESEGGPPSDATVHRVAEKLEDQFLNLGGELVGQPFKRGQELISRGRGEIPGGTVIYPVRFEEFAVTFYLSQDSFGGWQFSVGEKNNSAGRVGLVQFKDRIVDLRFSSDLVIALGQPRKPAKPETEAAKQERLRKEGEEATAHAERMKNSGRWQAEEAEKAKQKLAAEEQRRLGQDEAYRRNAEGQVRQDDERSRREGTQLAEAKRNAEEERRKQQEAQDRAIAEELEKTKRSLGSPGSSGMGSGSTTTEIAPAPPATEPGSKTAPTPEKSVRLAEAKAELAGLDSKIGAERQRYQQATDTINRLTNFKKTPVKEGSAAYHQCVEASRVIQEVEQKAPTMTAEKRRLETLVAELKNK